MNKEIRWKQRFSNFEKAYRNLETAVNMETYSKIERAGLIQYFEFTFELAWKTLKDYLESKEIIAKFPRDVIKQAFHYEILEEGEIWMDMLKKRNLFAHTYDEQKAKIASALITNSYFKAVTQVFKYLLKETDK